MKKLFSLVLAIVLLFSLSVTAYAVGEGNIDGGGGGMGSGNAGNVWSPGNEGVRVSVVRASDHATVATVDYTNKNASAVRLHFGYRSKLQYRGGAGLSPSMSAYRFVKPGQTMPRIISTSGQNNIAAIKSYFTDEQVIRGIARDTGMSFDVLVGGGYKLLLEPIAYYQFQGIMVASTAHEAALYDEQTSGLLRYWMVSLTHKNLPLAMFLEVSDLGFPAWSGSRNSEATNANIKAALGLGIVRFEDQPEAPGLSTYDYEYRVNTQVITSVTVEGGQSDPDTPTTVHFSIGGAGYTVSNVYYPEGDSQLVWVKWTTPATPQTMVINVTVSGPGSTTEGTINVNIVDLNRNPPPNPVADDRNDSFSAAPVPSKPQMTLASWGVWRPWWLPNWEWHENLVWVSNNVWVTSDCTSLCPRNCPRDHGRWEDHGRHEDQGWWEDNGWWEFDFDRYSASLTATSTIRPDGKNPTAGAGTMKSGYGINQTVTASVSSSQSSATTAAQNSVSFFPEFRYQTYWRLLDRTVSGQSSSFQFKQNEYSTYRNRTHFTPVWMPDGSYTVYTWLIDAWTPAGMLSMNLTSSLTISGSLWDDWHIAPVKPE